MSLDDAWAEAEAVLPVGWELTLEFDSMTYRAEARESGPRSEVGMSIAALWVDDDKPDSALRRLAARMATRR